MQKFRNIIIFKCYTAKKFTFMLEANCVVNMLAGYQTFNEEK